MEACRVLEISCTCRLALRRCGYVHPYTVVAPANERNADAIGRNDTSRRVGNCLVPPGRLSHDAIYEHPPLRDHGKVRLCLIPHLRNGSRAVPSPPSAFPGLVGMLGTALLPSGPEYSWAKWGEWQEYSASCVCLPDRRLLLHDQHGRCLWLVYVVSP